MKLRALRKGTLVASGMASRNEVTGALCGARFVIAVLCNFAGEMAQSYLYEPMGDWWQPTRRCLLASECLRTRSRGLRLFHARRMMFASALRSPVPVTSTRREPAPLTVPAITLAPSASPRAPIRQ